MATSLVGGVHDGVLTHPPAAKIQRRALSADAGRALALAFRKSWSTLRRLDRQLEDPSVYDEEANAWIPSHAYHAVLGSAVATG